jgi:Putative Ig domain/Domain of unknown function (DUF4114)/FG-GAP-like repeat
MAATGSSDPTLTKLISIPDATDVSILQELDLNGDGKADILFKYKNTLTKKETIGLTLAGTSPTFIPLSTDNIYINDQKNTDTGYLKVLDINGDGKSDIVFNYANYTTNKAGIGAILASSNPTFTPLTTGNVTVTYTALLDINGDDRPDLVETYYDLTAKTNGLGVILAGSSTPQFTPITTDNQDLRSPILVDINGDGKLDVVASYNNNTTKKSGLGAILAGSSTPVFINLTPDNLQFSGSTTLEQRVDVNGDGKLDLAFAYRDTITNKSGLGTIVAGATPTFAGFDTGTFFPSSPAVADVNNDGKLDLVSTYFDSTLTKLNGVGVLLAGSSTFTPIAPDNPDITTFAPVSIDINGDGKSDLIYRSYNTTTGKGGLSAVLTGSTTPTLTNLTPDNPNLLLTSLNSGVVVDANGDGKPDLVFSYEDTATKKYGLGAILAGSSPTFVSLTTRDIYTVAPQLIDINNDGKIDLLLGYSNIKTGTDSGLGVVLAGSDPTLTTLTTVNPDQSPTIVDLNGDGKLDIVYGTNQNGLGVVLASNTPTFTSIATGNFDFTSPVISFRRRTKVVDINGDGKQDVVLPYFDNTVKKYGVGVLLGGITPIFVPAVSTDSVLFSAETRIADVNGDGIQDFIGTDQNKNNIFVISAASGTIAANRSPIVANPIAAKTATAGTAFNFTIPTNTFSDPDAGDALTYIATLADGKALPPWLTFNATTGLFTGTPATTDVGNLNLRVTATDKGGLSVFNDFGLSIGTATVVNRSPVVANLIMSTAVTQGNLFNFTVPANTFSDPDPGDTLTYSAKLANGNPLPAWVSFNATTGVFSGTPTASDVGNVVFQIKATDKGGLSVTTDFGLTIVGTTTTNRSPIVANPIAAQSATAGTAFSLTVPTNTFTDPDAGDVLSYTASLANGNALPAWLTFNATTGLFSGMPTATDVGSLSLSVKATDKGGLSVTNNFGLSISSNPTPNPNTPIPGLRLTANNLFNTDASIPGFSIQALSQKPSNKVNQIAMFAVDDATGTIGNLLPGAAGYLQAALAVAKPIFSTLGGSFFSTDAQQVALQSNTFNQFIEIQDGSILDLQQQLAKGVTPTNVLFSLPDAKGNSPIKVTENSTKDGYQISINEDELVLGLSKLAGDIFNPPIGTKSQTLPEGRTIDLTDYANKTLKVDLNAKSDALFNNNIGFYAVEDAAGTIKLADGTSIGVSDSRYAVEAVKKAIATAITANKNDNKTGQDIAGGSLYAPVAISQGTLNDFVNANPTNEGDGQAIHAYFNYLGANPDKVDHFRLLGANTFGFEDIYGGGDRDFNDVVVNLKIST